MKIYYTTCLVCTDKINKKWLCKIFWISRSWIYYKKKQIIKDIQRKTQVNLVNILGSSPVKS